MSRKLKETKVCNVFYLENLPCNEQVPENNSDYVIFNIMTPKQSDMTGNSAKLSHCKFFIVLPKCSNYANRKV